MKKQNEKMVIASKKAKRLYRLETTVSSEIIDCISDYDYYIKYEITYNNYNHNILNITAICGEEYNVEELKNMFNSNYSKYMLNSLDIVDMIINKTSSKRLQNVDFDHNGEIVKSYAYIKTNDYYTL